MADGTDTIEWGEPPPGTPNNAGRWLPKFVKLMKKPGKWARIHLFEGEGANAKAAATASNMRNGKVSMPAGRFEVVHRRLEEDRTKVGLWARYLGEDEDEVEEDEDE